MPNKNARYKESDSEDDDEEEFFYDETGHRQHAGRKSVLLDAKKATREKIVVKPSDSARGERAGRGVPISEISVPHHVDHEEILEEELRSQDTTSPETANTSTVASPDEAAAVAASNIPASAHKYPRPSPTKEKDESFTDAGEAETHEPVSVEMRHSPKPVGRSEDASARRESSDGPEETSRGGKSGTRDNDEVSQPNPVPAPACGASDSEGEEFFVADGGTDKARTDAAADGDSCEEGDGAFVTEGPIPPSQKGSSLPTRTFIKAASRPSQEPISTTPSEESGGGISAAARAAIAAAQREAELMLHQGSPASAVYNEDSPIKTKKKHKKSKEEKKKKKKDKDKSSKSSSTTSVRADSSF